MHLRHSFSHSAWGKMEQSLAYVALLLVLFSCVFPSAALGGCGANTCISCTGSSGWFGKCGWCKRDNQCHNEVSILTQCSAAETIMKESHCDDELARYDTTLSWKMLLLSAADYFPIHLQQCLNNALPSSKIEIKAFVAKQCGMLDGNCAGYVAISHVEKAIVVSFRGSDNLDQALVIFLESMAIPMEEFLGGRVQSYWKRAFDDLWGSMEPKVRELRATYPHYKLWVTGHSLGGAMASLTSTWLSYHKIAPRQDIILYTFGMPRVGDYSYAFQHDTLVNNSWRVVNFNDVVPHFPTLASVYVLSGPYHHGVEVYYMEPATSVDSPHKECHGKPFNEDRSCSLTTFPHSIERHKHYFGIDLGEFWKTKCVLSTSNRKAD